MKVVINSCYGGFSISAAAVKRLAEIKGKKCYFFTSDIGQPYKPATLEEVQKTHFWHAFTVPNPNKLSIKRIVGCYLTRRPDDRADPDLVRVVEELGDAANGMCARLKIVEVPDDVEWFIDEYDGLEHVAEHHQTWG